DRASPGSSPGSARATKSSGFVGPNSFGRDVALVFPAAAQRPGEVDDRQPHVARGENLQRLRLEELALRVEHLEVWRVTRAIAQPGQVERAFELGAALGLRRKRVAHGLVRHQRIV